MSKITINNVELELNLLDADILEKYENQMSEIQETIHDPKNYENVSHAEGMRFQCRCIEGVFDNIFGAGTAAKIFPQNNDLGARLEAFAMLGGMAVDAKNEMNDIKGKYLNRAANRAERRAQKRGNRNNRNYNYGNRSL